jgi:hypothetical protein
MGMVAFAALRRVRPKNHRDRFKNCRDRLTTHRERFKNCRDRLKNHRDRFKNLKPNAWEGEVMNLLWLETLAIAVTVASAAASYWVLARIYAEPSASPRDARTASDEKSA